jgi:hypothetical protein
MSWWEFFNSVAGGASILGAILAVLGWVISRGTNRLIAQGDARTQEILAQMEARTTAVLDRMDARATERHTDTLAVLERIDARAEERHRETR